MTDRVGPHEVAASLDLDLDDLAICQACLSFVSFAVDSGDEGEIRRWTAKMTPDLWAEGLALPARLALERARKRGVPGADGASWELEQFGPDSAIARAIVRKLAEEQWAQSRSLLERLDSSRQRPSPAPPE